MKLNTVTPCRTTRVMGGKRSQEKYLACPKWKIAPSLNDLEMKFAKRRQMLLSIGEGTVANESVLIQCNKGTVSVDANIPRVIRGVHFRCC